MQYQLKYVMAWYCHHFDVFLHWKNAFQAIKQTTFLYKDMKKLNVVARLVVTCLCFCATLATHAYNYLFTPLDNQFDQIAARLDRLDYENRREQISAADIALLQQIAMRGNNAQLQCRVIYWRVRATQMDANSNECIRLLEAARKKCGEQYDYDLARINYQLAGNYERQCQYLKAYNMLSSTLPVFEKYGDNYFLGNAYLLMVQLFDDINDPDNARLMLKPASDNYRKAGFTLNRIYFFEALLSDRQAQKMKYYELSTRSGGANDWGMTVQALSELASICMDRGELDKAQAYISQAFRILDSKAPQNIVFHTLVKIKYIELMCHQQRYAEAITELNKVLAHADMLKGERFLADVYQLMWRASEHTGNRAESYRYLRLYMEEYQRNVTEIMKQEVPKARAREAIARRNDAIKLLAQDAELSRRMGYVAVLLLVVLLLVGVVAVVYFYQRYKIRRIENRELRNSLRQEALIYSVNRKNFENDIKQKDCEISSSTLLLANKNEVLQQISAITKSYYDEGKVPAEYVAQVNAVIGDSLKNDDEWQRFKLHFDSVHPNFFVKLKELSAKLTENDLRLCAYISIGMRAKQIAEMLSVSPDSVNTNRYRLRKKLGLQRGDSLDEYLRRI